MKTYTNAEVAYSALSKVNQEYEQMMTMLKTIQNLAQAAAMGAKVSNQIGELQAFQPAKT